MAVSYLSQAFRSDPYVLPLDLNLFSSVLSIKQNQFNENGKKIQAQIDQLGMLDVIKEEDRNYLNSKINNLVTSLNTYGGVNLSDINTANQLESLGADIYSDNNVLNAISATRKVRGLMGSYEKYKTDPKLSKLYSEVNEAYDMSAVSAYMNDGKLGSTYQGPTSATPYTPYRDNHIKMFEKLKADLTTNITDKGYYILKENNERVSPDRIMSMAADLLTPQERSQLKRDSWYLYRNVDPSQLLAKGASQYQQRLDDAVRLKNEYETLAQDAIGDPIARRNYNILADNQAKVVSAINSAKGDFAAGFQKAYETNKEELFYQVYSDDYFRGLANRFSVNRTERSIQADQAQMFTEKMAQADRHFSQEMGLANKKFGLEERKFGLEEEKLQLEYAKLGKYRHVDPVTGKVELLNLSEDGSQHLTTILPNTENPNDLKITKETLDNENTNLKLENDKIVQEIINNAIAEHPELGIESVSSLGKGNARRLKAQEYLEDFNQQPGLQLEDFRMFESETLNTPNVIGLQGYTRPPRTGYENYVFDEQTQLWYKKEDINKAPKQTRYKNDTLVQRFGHLANLNSGQLQWFANQWKNYEALALGKGSVTSDLVDGFQTKVENIQMNKERIRANEKITNETLQEVFEELGTPEEDRALLREYVTTGYDNARMVGMGRLKIGKFDVGRVSEVKDLLSKKLTANNATRNVYGVRTLGKDDPLIKYGELQNLIRQEIIDQKAEPYRGSEEVDIEKVQEINPRLIGKASDGSGRYVVISDVIHGSGDKKKTSQYTTYVDNKNAQLFGINPDPYENLNYSVKTTGRSGDLFIYGNKNMTVYANIVDKNPSNLNDNSAFAQVKVYYLGPNGEKLSKFDTIKIPSTDGRTPSEAFVLAKQIVNLAAQKQITNEEFLEYLRNYKNQGGY